MNCGAAISRANSTRLAGRAARTLGALDPQRAELADQVAEDDRRHEASQMVAQAT